MLAVAGQRILPKFSSAKADSWLGVEVFVLQHRMIMFWFYARAQCENQSTASWLEDTRNCEPIEMGILVAHMVLK